jgi:hypothetical protein
MNLKSINSRLRVPLGGAIALALFAALPARAQYDYPSTVLAQGPVGYWRLNETTPPQPPITTAANLGSLGATGNGTYNGGQGFYRGFPGALANSDTAVHFDGTSQFVSVPYDATLNPSTFTIEGWLSADNIAANCALSCGIFASAGRSGWLIYQTSQTGYELRMYKDQTTAFAVDVVGTTTNVVGVYTHVVATFDGTTAKMYLNGALANSGTLNAPYVFGTNGSGFTIGERADAAFLWAGKADEVAYYNTALDANTIAAHYACATTNAALYPNMILASSPMLYFRLDEAGDPPAANLGTLGSAGNGAYSAGTTPGVAGPRPSAYPGFEADNDAVKVDGAGSSVAIAPLNLNANTVTISGWVNTSGNTENSFSGIVMCDSGTTYSGLNMDLNGTGLSYTWANDGNTYNWVPSDPPNLGGANLPMLPASGWAYVALVVHPDQAWIYICASNNPAGFAGATNTPPGGHGFQAFDGTTLIGSDAGSVSGSFGGNIDEVAIWNRALGVGELYTQYGAAVGGLGPKIFGDLQGPPGTVAAGDPLVLSVDAGGTPPLTFTWHANGGTVGSTSSNTLVIASSSLSDSGTYDVTITNASGSAQSASVSVTVVTPSQPAIIQLVGYQNRTLYPSGTLSMAVVGTGGGLKYQWYKNAAPIASATSSAFTIASVTTNDAGGYSVYVTNSVSNATSGPPAVITIPSVASGSYEAAVLATTPEAWWRLDEPAGSTNMFDGMGRHPGTYTNATGSGPLPGLGVTGALVNDTNPAASFSSTDKGIGLVPFSPALNPSSFSVEAWVNTAVITGQSPVSSSYGTGPTGWWMQSIADSGTGWWFGDCSAGYFGNNKVNGAYVNTNGSILPGYWSHIVIVHDGTSATTPNRVYVNGTTDGYVWGGAPLNTAGPFIIGARGVSATTIADEFFDGSVDEVAVYTRVLSAAEVTSHYTARGIVNIPLTFTTALLSQTVTTGKSVSFSTSLIGTPPISLQWYKDGKIISNATNSTYAIASTGLGDAGTYILWGTNIVATNSLSASLAVIQPVGYANVTNNLVLHLRFDGDTTDSSGHGNNGTPSSPTAPTFVSPGIIGSQALHYETIVVTNVGVSTNIQSTSYVTLGSVGSGPPTDLQFGASTSFSVSLWVKLEAGALPADVPFIGTATNANNNAGWDLSPSFYLGGWQWDLNDGVSIAGNNINANGADGSINDGNWHNFVLTVDRTAKVAETYLDGVHAASTSIASLGSIDNNNYWPIVIGQDPTYAYHQGAYGPFAASATLDDIGIWRQALTALEVAQIASAGSTSGHSFDTVAPSNTQPDITGISISGGTVTIKFTAGASDPASAFTLFSSGTVTGTYSSAVGASVTGSAGSYTATVPANGAMQFYRIQR